MTKKNCTDDNNLIDINKDKLIKEIKNIIIDELENDLINIVDNNSKDKLDSMEKKIYKYKNKTIRKKNIIIIILILIIILENKLLYDKGTFNKYLANENKEVLINDENKEKLVKDLDYYKDKYGYLLDMINTNLDVNNYNYLYKEDYKVKDIDNNVKLNISYMNIKDNNISTNNGVKTVNEDIIRESYNKIFNDNKYEVSNFNYSCLNFIYNKNTLSYMAIDTGCDIDKTIIKDIVDIKENNNNIDITALVGINDKNNNTLYNINGDLIDGNYDNKDLSKYKDKLSKYKYTFILDDDNYYFWSIEKVN